MGMHRDLSTTSFSQMTDWVVTVRYRGQEHDIRVRELEWEVAILRARQKFADEQREEQVHLVEYVRIRDE